MILSDGVAYVREKLQAFVSLNKMTEGKTLPVLDGLIILELNRAQEKAAAHAHFYKGIKSPYLIPTVKKQALYDKPAGLLEIDYVKYSSNIRFWELTKVEKRTLLYWQRVGNHDPSGYDDKSFKGKIHLYPAPRYTGELIQIYASYLPPRLTKDEEEFYMPEPYASGLCDLALSRILNDIFGTEAAARVAEKAETRYKENVEACRQKFAFTGNGSQFVRNIRTGGM